MTSHPPAAEQDLGSEDDDAESYALRVAWIEMQSPMIIDGCTYNALCDIVSETHAAIGHDETHGAGKTCGVEREEERGDDDEHEAELMERGDDEHQRRHERSRRHGAAGAVAERCGRHRRDNVGDERAQSVEREEQGESHGKGTRP